MGDDNNMDMEVITIIIDKLSMFFDVFFWTIGNKGMKFQNAGQKNITILMVPKSQ